MPVWKILIASIYFFTATGDICTDPCAETRIRKQFPNVNFKFDYVWIKNKIEIFLLASSLTEYKSNLHTLSILLL